MVHVCFCFSDKTGYYAKFVGTAMLSLFENTYSDVTVHIFHDSTLTNENRDKFSYLTGRYDQFVKFYNVEKLCAEDFSKMKKDNPQLLTNKRFTIGMMFRLFIPQILPNEIDKVIYLDADIIVNMNLKELYQIEIEDKYLAVVTSNSIAKKKHTHTSRNLCVMGFVEPDDYFNSGVLLMNLNILRGEKKRIMDGINFIGSDSRNTHFDQDVLNYCFSNRTLKLPIRFNNSVSYARGQKETSLEPKIYHYLGSNYKSFGMDMSDPFNRLWMSYFIKTPWFDAESIGRLYSKFQSVRKDLEGYVSKVSSAVQGKTRAFFIEPKKVESMKKIFSIRNDEKVILAENETSIQKLIDAMNHSNGEYLFFIMTENFQKKAFPFDRLAKAGFSEGKDFLKGWELLSSAKGVPFNSYPLIQAL